SPDGTRVAFARGDSKTQNIFVTPANGGPAQQVTFMKSLNWSPAWSPDGRSIAFSSNEGGATKVWQGPASGGTPRSVSHTNVSATPERLPVVWAPGRNILYQRPGNGNYYMLDPGTGSELPLSKNDSVGFLFAPVYSPDGNQVIMLWNRSSRPMALGRSGSPGRGLYLIPFEGSVPNEQKARLLTGTLIFGIGQSVDAAAYRGKEIKLSAHVKANVTGENDAGQCWLRVDKPNAQRGFFDNMDDRPIRAPSWNVYEITGKVERD